MPVLRRQPRRPSARGSRREGRGLVRRCGRPDTLLAAVDEAVEKCARGDDGGAGLDGAAIAQLEAQDAACGRDRTGK